MGVAVFSGMLGVTFSGLFLTPVFYVLLREMEKRVARGALSGAKVAIENDEFQDIIHRLWPKRDSGYAEDRMRNRGNWRASR